MKKLDEKRKNDDSKLTLHKNDMSKVNQPRKLNYSFIVLKLIRKNNFDYKVITG